MSTKSIKDLSNQLSFYTPESADLLKPKPTSEESTKSYMSSIKAIFGSSSESSSSPDVLPTQDEESAGLMNWASAKITDARSSIDTIGQTKERFTIFSILAISGIVCMILAFTFLPIIILSPHKFALLFTMGSGLILVSFSFLRGHIVLFKHLASIERLPFSASYGVSLIGTLYCSLVMGSYLLTLVFSIIQVIALTYFLVSYIPGGTSALTFIGGTVASGIKGLVVR